MAKNESKQAKTYVVMKDGEAIKELRGLAAAKKAAQASGADVFCEGKCVYRGGAAEDAGVAGTEGGKAVKVEKGVENGTVETEKAVETDVAKKVEITKELEAVLNTKDVPNAYGRYRLKCLMNVRKAPSLQAEKAGTLPAGTEVVVKDIACDWLQLVGGNFILYGGGKFAEKIG